MIATITILEKTRFLVDIEETLEDAIREVNRPEFSLEDSDFYLHLVQDIFKRLSKLQLFLDKSQDEVDLEISDRSLNIRHHAEQFKTNCLMHSAKWEANQLEKIQHLFDKVCRQPLNKKNSGFSLFENELTKLMFNDKLSQEGLNFLINLDAKIHEEQKVFADLEIKAYSFSQALTKLLSLLDQDEVQAEQFFLTHVVLEDQQIICKTLFSLFVPKQAETNHLVQNCFGERFHKDQKLTALNKCLEEQQILLHSLGGVPKNEQALFLSQSENGSSDLGIFNIFPEEIIDRIFSHVDSVNILLNIRLICLTFSRLAELHIAKKYKNLLNKEMTFVDAFQYMSTQRNYLDKMSILKSFKLSRPIYKSCYNLFHLIKTDKRIFLISQFFKKKFELDNTTSVKGYNVDIWDLTSQTLIGNIAKALIINWVDGYLLLQQKKTILLLDLNLLAEGIDPYVFSFALSSEFLKIGVILKPFSSTEILIIAPDEADKLQTFFIFNKKTKESHQIQHTPLDNEERIGNIQEGSVLQFISNKDSSISFYRINKKTFEFEKLSFLSAEHSYYFLDESTLMFGNSVTGLFEIYDFNEKAVIAQLVLQHPHIQTHFSLSELGYFVFTKVHNDKHILLVGKVIRNEEGKKELFTKSLEIEELSGYDVGSFDKIIPWMFCVNSKRLFGRLNQDYEYTINLSQFAIFKNSTLKVKKNPQSLDYWFSDSIKFNDPYKKVFVKDIFFCPISLRREKIVQLYKWLQTERPQDALDFFMTLSSNEQQVIYQIFSDQETFFNGQKATNEQIASAISALLIHPTQLLSVEQNKNNPYQKLADLCLYSLPTGAKRLFARLSSPEKELVYTELEQLLGVSETGYLGQGEDAWFNQNGQKATNAQRQQALAMCFKIERTTTELNPRKRRASTELVR